MFQEQVCAISQLFTEWSEAEQMVLLYSLLKRLSPLQIRFLSRVVDQHMTECAEIQMIEQQANSPAFVSSLLSKSKSVAMSQLLVLLPLLRSGNIEAKSRYMTVIPTVLSHSVETGENLTDAKQLLSYSLIHPAILSDERKQLTSWAQILKARINVSSATACVQQQQQQQQNEQTSNNWLSLDRAVKENRQHMNHVQQQQLYNQHVRVRRSNSLTPPVSFAQVTSDLWTSQDDLCAKQKPRSFSLSCEHAPPLSPQSSQASSGSGSESQLDETKSYTSDLPGMKDIGSWLKILRLHKYIWLFAQLSYDEMLSLTEEKLEIQGVTKGARHKIILSIRKLKERYNNLCQLEKEVIGGGTNLMSALEELKSVLCSPIKPVTVDDSKKTDDKTDNNVEDIPAQFTKVMGKVCTHLIVNGSREEDAGRLATWILERCMSHEAFVPHRKRIDTWRLQLQTLWQHTHHRHKWYQNQTHYSSGSNLPDTRSLRRPSGGSSGGYHSNRTIYTPPQQINLLCNQPPTQQQYQQMSPTSSADSTTPTQQQQHQLKHLQLAYSGLVSSKTTPPNNLVLNENRLQDANAAQQVSNCVQRTTTSPNPSDPDINSRLEDLCLSMTEHFLSGVS